MKIRTRYRRLLRRLKDSPRHTVRCTKCGFLTIGGRELSDAERCMLEDPRGPTPSHLDELACSRNLWTEYELSYVPGDAGLLLNEATKPRKCRGYFKYNPGWPPDGHRDLLLRSQDRMSDRLGNLLFTLLGAAVALAAQWLAKRLGF